MKKIKILPLVLILTLVLACLTPGALADEAETLTPPELQSAAAIIIDQDTGRELYSLNADEQRYPASLTKIMTVLLAVEAVDRGEVSLDDSVTAGDEAIQGMVEDGSTANIQVGETMSLNDLLYCAMLSSANEACNIIAVYIAGSLDAFVEDMNSRAEEIGCTNTHFANTHGLPDSNHYTTARDSPKSAALRWPTSFFTTCPALSATPYRRQTCPQSGSCPIQTASSTRTAPHIPATTTNTPAPVRPATPPTPVTASPPWPSATA